ncbi:putative glycoside hydrolase [Ornithinibacillus salinisoli]|uniref:Glycoside hydrolase n=1 Tax=Ornithinibacillus salinisoli TaxID=1848459 RepID=A0ABW4VUQ6_9BACI
MLQKNIYLILIILLLHVGCTTNEAQEGSIFQETPNSLENMKYTGDDHIDNSVEEQSEDGKQIKEENNQADQDAKEPETEKPAEKPKKRDVKGIYLNRNSIREENINKYIDLVKSSDLNAVVIDIKDDYGKISYDSKLDRVNEIGSDDNPTVDDMKKFIQRLKEEDIYTIARIVTFKDPFLADKKSEYALKRKNGNVWSDNAGVKWIDPFKKEVWEYVTDISEEIAQLGIDEIQYDYIRFPENAKKVDQEVAFDNPDNISKSDVIQNFLSYSKEKLANYPVYVSADVFGLVTTVEDDMGIGQKWEKISPLIDYISPMTYPSHYAPNTYGIGNPDRHPYDVMKNAMQDAKARNQMLKEDGKDTAIIRPWIQDFDYKSNYTAEDVKNQIKALKEEQINQYLLWNASNKYTEAAL